MRYLCAVYVLSLCWLIIAQFLRVSVGYRYTAVSSKIVYNNIAAGETIVDSGAADESFVGGDKENEDVNAIVKSVVNTIRDLSAKLHKTEQSNPCPVCGDIISGLAIDIYIINIIYLLYISLYDIFYTQRTEFFCSFYTHNIS